MIPDQEKLINEWYASAEAAQMIDQQGADTFSAFRLGAIFMTEYMHARSELQKRSAWNASRMLTMNNVGEFNFRFERFEDWNITPKDGSK